MTVVAAFFLLGGMPSGLAAYLQADMKGWRVVLWTALWLLMGLGMLVWAAVATYPDEQAFAGDPRALAGGVLGGTMLLALIGAIIGKAFADRIEPVSLGLRTTVSMSLAGFFMDISGVV